MAGGFPSEGSVGLEVPRRNRSAVLKYVPRGIHAAILVLINYAFFFLAPSILYNLTGQLTPNVETTITAYFSVIVTLTVIRIMLKGHVLAAASAVCLGFVEAVYIYSITNGGVLSVSVMDLFVTMEFQPILYLMMTPPLIGSIRQIWDAVNKSASQPVSMIEVVED
ncbi:MAG: hypothetical protein HYU39_10345 [Thaumarchaeota archaeon]|nr:hypothetical protein [Nitrososphaerota archaeon]